MTELGVSGARLIVDLAPPGVEMAFCRIPAGTFRMGSRGEGWPDEEPRHLVTIPHAFWLGETPVTQQQLAAWPGRVLSGHENRFANRATHPADSVTWQDAVDFCAWLTRATALPVDAGLACLPTEAEWEYACRAGTETQYYTGDGATSLGDAGWFDGNADGSTQPVWRKTPNAFGLFDMHGNVWEWCHDARNEQAYRVCVNGEDDPGHRFREDDYRMGGPASGRSRWRVLRGGAWNDTAFACRSASRLRLRPAGRSSNFGFRVCLVRGSAPLSEASERNKPATARLNGAARDERAKSSRAVGGGRSSGGASPEAPSGRWEER